MATADNEFRSLAQLDAQLAAEDDMDKEFDIDMIALMYRLLEKLKWIVLTAFVGALIAALVTINFIAPTYKATAKLYVLNSGNTAINLSELNLGDKLAADYVQVFKNWHVHEMVIKSLGLPYNHQQIQSMLSISVPTSTRIIQITVTSNSPQEARDIAMAYAQFAPSFIEAKMATSRPTIFEEARIPTKPSSPSLVRNTLLGFLIGGFLVAAVVILQFIVDDRIVNGEMIQKRLGIPTLGMMPIQSGEARKTKKGDGKA